MVRACKHGPVESPLRTADKYSPAPAGSRRSLVLIVKSARTRAKRVAPRCQSPPKSAQTWAPRAKSTQHCADQNALTIGDVLTSIGRVGNGNMAKMTTDPDFVRDARERLGLTQTEFGAQLGVSKRTVIRWEGGAPLKRRDRVAITLLVERPRARRGSHDTDAQRRRHIRSRLSHHLCT